MASAFLYQVSPGSGVPLYRQLMEQVRSLVASGRLRPGDLLPSVRQAAEELEINPMTVSKAYSLLEREGLLELERGQGMRVRARAPAGRLKERQEALLPLLRQVTARAYQLALTPEQVLAALKPLLEDLRRD